MNTARGRSALSAIALSVALAARADEPGFVPLFDGKTLTGWHVSSKTGHGTGGRWFVEDGAILGTQDKPGNGGLVLTDAAFGDFEVALETRNDYGPDSGLFLRSTEDGRCYQAMIDYHDNGNLMGIYGEGTGGFVARNFLTLDAPDKIKLLDSPAFPAPFTPEGWKALWRAGEWNALRARIAGNPPTIETWVNGVQVMRFVDTEKRLPDRGGIGLQIHGGGDLTKQRVRYRNVRVRELDAAAAQAKLLRGAPSNVPENALSDEEKAAGWKRLFDGKTLDGWMTSGKAPSKVPVEDGAINPHGCGGYMMVHKETWADFVLALDFKIGKGCNSGIFLRTHSLDPKPGWDVGYNGIEVQVLDGAEAGLHDCGAIYDLVKPAKNAMRPAGEWNHIQITCDRNLILVVLNGEAVTRMDLDAWTEPGKRPDGTAHKFAEIAYKDFPRAGLIGLQDHGSPCWYKNVKLRPLR